MACDPLLTQPGPKDVTLTFASPDTWQWVNWPISWAYWDGAGWRTVAGSAVLQPGAWRVTLPALPALVPSTINGAEAGWLRAQLELPLPPGRTGQLPDSIAIGVRNPQDMTLPLAPFPADSPVQRFYLSADEAFSAGGARLTMQVQLSQPGAGAGVQLDWLYQADGQWLPLGQSSSDAEQTGDTTFDFHDGTRAFTQDGEISFHVPMSWPSSLYRSRTGRWLRIDVASGQYATPPAASHAHRGVRLAAAAAGRHHRRQSTPGPPAARCGSPPRSATASPIDLSKDFYPFGQQPQFNDTFYVACPDALASRARSSPSA